MYLYSGHLLCIWCMFLALWLNRDGSAPAGLAPERMGFGREVVGFKESRERGVEEEERGVGGETAGWVPCHRGQKETKQVPYGLVPAVRPNIPTMFLTFLIFHFTRNLGYRGPGQKSSQSKWLLAFSYLICNSYHLLLNTHTHIHIFS